MNQWWCSADAGYSREWGTTAATPLQEHSIIFTEQGLEKYHDTVTKDYFWSSSHKDKQLLLRQCKSKTELNESNCGADASELWPNALTSFGRGD